MDINQNSLDLLTRTVNTSFQSAFDQNAPLSQGFTSTIPMTTRQVNFATLARLPRMREWINGRVVNSAYTQNRVVTAKIFEETLGIDKYDIIDDQYGVLQMAVAELGQQASQWQDDLVFDYVLNHATVDNGFDGVPCYSTSHPTVGAGISGFPLPSGVATTQSNLFVSTALTYDNYASVRAKMQSLVGPDGHSLKVNPNLLIVPPALESTAKLILQAELIPNTSGNATQSNVWANTAQLVVVPQLAAYPNNWWLLDSSKAMKPWIFHQLTAPFLTTLTSPTDANVFLNRQFLWGLEARGIATESVWFLSAAATSEAAYIHS